MAKRRGRPKTSERNDRTARIDSALLSLAEMVAKSRNVSLAEYLTETLRGPVNRDFAKAMEQAKRQAGEMEG